MALWPSSSPLALALARARALALALTLALTLTLIFNSHPHQAKKIENPAYKGEWNPKQIPNKDYVKGEQLAAFDAKYIGFELWIVNNGTISANIANPGPYHTPTPTLPLPLP